ncbi:Sua5 family C-terminal domain-containing protein [Caballeronia sp. M23-90]
MDLLFRPARHGCTLLPSKDATRRACVKTMYGLLRKLDREDVERILIETLPVSAEWSAVNDRLGRAAAAFEEQE